jgi:hypothetical protein
VYIGRTLACLINLIRIWMLHPLLPNNRLVESAFCSKWTFWLFIYVMGSGLWDGFIVVIFSYGALTLTPHCAYIWYIIPRHDVSGWHSLWEAKCIVCFSCFRHCVDQHVSFTYWLLLDIVFLCPFEQLVCFPLGGAMTLAENRLQTSLF